jgi:uncharacterized membrane protein YjfL (UPF0719 family)
MNLSDYPHLASVISVALWTLFAVVLLAGAMKLFDLLTPGKLEEHVFKDQNVAAATVYAGAFVAFAIVIASAMH